MSEQTHHIRKRWSSLLPGIAVILCILTAFACGCTQPSQSTVTPTPTATTPGMANPAAVACVEDKLQYEIRQNPDGSQYGVCIMADGTVCDEWAYFRGECPAPVVTTTGAGMANPSAVYCEDRGMTYETRTNTDGSQFGVCILADGSICDAWEFYRGDCPAPASMPGAGIANPSAVFCEDQGMTYEIRTNPDGSQTGVCILANGTVCDGWEYYRDECP